MDRPAAQPLHPSLGRFGKRLIELIEGLTDDHRVVMRTFHCSVGDGIALSVATHGLEGFERFVGALIQIEADVGTDDEGIWLEVTTETNLDRTDEPEVCPDWAIFALSLRDPDGEAPSARLLRDVALAAQAHHASSANSMANGRPALRVVSAGPAAVRASRVPAHLRGVVAAFEAIGVRVVEVRAGEFEAWFALAAYGAARMRALSRAVDRLTDGLMTTETWLECQLLFHDDDSPRCDFARHPGWGFFGLQIRDTRRESSADGLEPKLARCAAALIAGQEGARRGTRRLA